MQASTSEKIITYSALFISVTALVLSLVEVNNMRDQTRLLQEQTELLVDQNKAAVWPNVSVFFSRSMIPYKDNDFFDLPLGAPVYSIYISNDGVGPALVKDIYIWVDGQPVRTQAAWRTALGLPPSTEKVWTSKTRGIVIPPSREDRFFLSEDPAFREKMGAYGPRVEFGVCYQSIFGDWWAVRRKLTSETEVMYTPCDSCPWPTTDAFLATQEDINI